MGALYLDSHVVLCVERATLKIPSIYTRRLHLSNSLPIPIVLDFHPSPELHWLSFISAEQQKDVKLKQFKDVKLKQFKKNISAITVQGSYYIFNNRNTETWHTPAEYIIEPTFNMWTMLNYHTSRQETILCLQEDLWNLPH